MQIFEKLVLDSAFVNTHAMFIKVTQVLRELLQNLVYRLHLALLQRSERPPQYQSQK